MKGFKIFLQTDVIMVTNLEHKFMLKLQIQILILCHSNHSAWKNF
jgi:hypothetical protein